MKSIKLSMLLCLLWLSNIPVYAQVLPLFSDDGSEVVLEGVSYSTAELDANTLAQLRQRVEQQADIRNNAGVEAIASKAYREAAEHFKAALKIRPDFKQAKINLAVAYIELKMLDKAQGLFSGLLSSYPEDVSLWRQQATLYLLQNNIEGAVEAYKEVAKRSDATEAYLGMARSYMAIGKHEKALAVLKDAEATRQNDLNIRYELGNAQLSLGNYREAFVAYDTIVRLQPKNYEALLQRGRTSFELNEYTASIDDFGRVMELRPNYVPAYNNRAAAYSQIRNHGAALSDLEKALELDPENGISWLNIGKVQLAIGRETEACNSWKRALELGRAEANKLISENCK